MIYQLAKLNKIFNGNVMKPSITVITIKRADPGLHY